MSRSGYSEDCTEWDLIRWRGAVNAARKGKRGQQMLRELLSALDAMPVKRLIAHELEQKGEVCALGCLGKARGLNLTRENVDPEDRERVAEVFGIAPALVAEIAFENDDDFAFTFNETPEHRWTRMRQWVASQIVGR